MQFTKIRLQGRSIIDLQVFGLRPTNTYVLKAIDGLGPTEVDVRIEDGIYLGRTPQDREIVMRVGLNPNYSVGQTAASMRTTLYGLLTPGPSDQMMFRLMNGPTTVAQIEGYIKRIEPVLSTKDPEVQITISCLGPYLLEEHFVETVPVASNAFTIDNIGSVTAGFLMEVEITQARANFLLYSEAAYDNDGPQLRLNHNFLVGDQLVIDTRDGQKGIRVTRGSNIDNIVRALTPESIWFQLHPGVNTFWTTSPDYYTWTRFRYRPAYWGA